MEIIATDERQKKLEYNRRWRAEHPEAVRAQYARYYAKHEDSVALAHARWRAVNPDYSSVYYEKNKETIRRKNALYAQTHREQRAEAQRRFKEANPTWSRYYERAHRDERNAARRERRRKDPEAVNARQRAWCRSHATRVREYHLKRNGVGDVPKGVLDDVFQQNIGLHHGILVCTYCDQRIEDVYHVDHILAVANGGTNEIANLCIACPSCNESKGKKDVDAWLWDKACKEWLRYL